MTPTVAFVAFVLGILWLFRLDRDTKSRVSPALWIPVIWLSIGASRNVSEWLGVAPSMDSLDQYLDGSPLDRYLFIVLMAAGLVVLHARHERVRTLLRANGPLLAFFLYCAISVLWSDYPFVALKRWTKVVGNLVMVLVVLTEADPSAAVKGLLARSSFMLVPLSILLIKYYPQLGRRYSAWTFQPMAVGVANDKNMLGAVCLVFGLGALWRLLEAFRNGERFYVRRRVIAQGAILLMSLGLLWQAKSATSWGCFVVGGGLLVLTSWRGLPSRSMAVHVVAVAIMAICFFGVFVVPDLGLVQAMGRESTLTGRTDLWRDLLGMTVDSWFGTGFESFWLGERAQLLWDKYWWHPNEAHNGFLEIYLNLGWFWVALLGVIGVWGYRNIVVSLRSSPGLGRLRLAYVVVAVIYNVTEAAFRVMNPILVIFILAVAATPPPATRRRVIAPMLPGQILEAKGERHADTP